MWAEAIGTMHAAFETAAGLPWVKVEWRLRPRYE